MNLNRKIEIIKRAVESLARHDDEDVAVRHAALDHVLEHVAAERAAMDERVRRKIADALKPTEA